MGLSLGGAATQVDGDGTSGFRRFAPEGGIWVRLLLPRGWATRLEFRYVGKGSYRTERVGDGRRMAYSLAFHYLELPIVAEYTWRERWRFGLGVSVGYLLHAREANAYGLLRLEGDRRPRPFELALQAVGGYQISPKWALRAGFAFSMLPVRGKPQDVTSRIRSGQYNRVVSLAVDYQF